MSLLWKISRNKYPNSFLLGTIHAICEEKFSIPEILKTSLASCDEIWLEINLNDVETQQKNYLLMQNEESLDKHLSHEDFAWFQENIIQKFHINYDSIKYLKPIFILYYISKKFIPCNSVSFEEKIISLALENQKIIQGLSTIEEQYQLGSDAFSYEDFITTLQHIPKVDYAKMYNDILNAYNDANLNLINQLILEYSFDNEKINSLLLEKRNTIWVERLVSKLQFKSCFIAVGAGHLSGKNGMISLLQKEGFKVKKHENLFTKNLRRDMKV